MARIGRLLDHFPGVEVAPLDRVTARGAAELRGRPGLAAPGALLAGTAPAAGCTAVIGNDRVCSEHLTEPACLCLSEHLD